MNNNNHNHNHNKNQSPIHNLDDLFRQEKKRLEQRPSEETWQKVERRLGQKRAAAIKRPLFFKPQIWAVAAVLLLVLLPVSFFILINNNDASSKKESSMAQMPAESTADSSPSLAVAAVQDTTTAATYTESESGSSLAQNNTPNTQPPTAASPIPAPASPSLKSAQQATSPQTDNIDNTGAATASKTVHGSDKKYPLIDLSTQKNALDFINTLKQYNNAYCVYVNKISAGWISDNDAGQLMAMLENTQPVPAVVRSDNQYRPGTPLRSTVGNEAFLLVKAYQSQHQNPNGAAYPLYANSVNIAANTTTDAAQMQSNNTTSQSTTAPLPPPPQVAEQKSRGGVVKSNETAKDAATKPAAPAQPKSTAAPAKQRTQNSLLYVNADEISKLREWWASRERGGK